MASGTGIFDTRKVAWDSQMQHYIKLKAAQLPEISEKSFGLNSAFAKRWPALSAAAWLPVVADGAANNIGSGCTTKDTAALMIGTSGAMRVVYEGDPPVNIPSGLWCYRIDRKRVVLGGALSDGGGLYDWLNAMLALPKDAEATIAKRKLGSHGLTFEPYLAGERSTGYNEHAVGSIAGIRTATTSVDILQAGMEAVGYRFAEIFRQLEGVTKIKTIVASGGAIKASPVWTNMIAAILDRKLTSSQEPEASMYGAVLLAMEQK
jgi:gluconokinase